MKRITSRGISDYRTNIVMNVLTEKYPELFIKGKFTATYIPITEQTIKLTDLLMEEQENYNEFFPEDNKVDLIIDKIVELYEPVVKRQRELIEIKKTKDIQNKEFFEDKTIVQLKTFTKKAKELSKLSKELDIHFETNISRLDRPSFSLYNDKSYDISERLDFLCEQIDHIIKTNYSKVK